MTTQAPNPTAVPPAPASPPTQDDRLLAACAHLSFLAGFWFIAPIAIYVIKRKESRFVAFHAIQAVLVQVFFGVALMVGAVASVVLIAAAGLSHHQELAAVVALVPLLGLAVSVLAVLGVHAFAAYAAWRGLDGSIPIVGRVARAIQGADEGAVKS